MAVVPIEAEGVDAKGLARDLAGRLGSEARLASAPFDPLAAYDASRRQYRSTILLDLLGGVEGDLVMGITSLDLFIPILTYVFGEALLGGRTAIVSAHRLDPPRYGMAPDPELLHERLLKEAVHEIGHCLGLVHCLAPACVMAASTIAEEVDLKGPDFCPRCRVAIGRVA